MTKENVEINKSIYNLFVVQILSDITFKFKKNVLKRQVNIPWMRYREINFIIDLLTNIKPRLCLEWGAGASTMFFTKYISSDAKWFSIEHDEQWAAKVAEENCNPNISISFQAPNHESIPGMYTCGSYNEENDGTYTDFQDYIEYPGKYAPFDFILVDGRVRKQCVIKSSELLAEDGIVLLHDANRSYYHDAFKHYKQGALFADQRNSSGGIWIGTNSKKALTEFIDVDTYVNLWSFYDKFGKIIKV